MLLYRFPRGHEGDQAVRGVGGILNDASRSPHTSLLVYVCQGGQRGTDDLTSCSHRPVQLFSLLNCTVAIPGGEAVGEDAFNGASIKHGQGWDRQVSSL